MMAKTKFHFIRPQFSHTAKAIDQRRGLVHAIQKECDDIAKYRTFHIKNAGEGVVNLAPVYLVNCHVDVERVSPTRLMVTFKSDHGEFAQVEVW